jgi:hypothetical protein
MSLVGNGTLPTPLSPAGAGLGYSQFRGLEKKLSTLPTLCTPQFMLFKYEGGVVEQAREEEYITSKQTGIPIVFSLYTGGRGGECGEGRGGR